MPFAKLLEFACLAAAALCAASEETDAAALLQGRWPRRARRQQAIEAARVGRPSGSVLVVVRLNVTDGAQFGEYLARARPVFPEYGVKTLAYGGSAADIMEREGRNHDGLVLINRYPNMSQVDALYSDPRYRDDAMPFRYAGSDFLNIAVPERVLEGPLDGQPVIAVARYNVRKSRKFRRYLKCTRKDVFARHGGQLLATSRRRKPVRVLERKPEQPSGEPANDASMNSFFVFPSIEALDAYLADADYQRCLQIGESAVETTLFALNATFA